MEAGPPTMHRLTLLAMGIFSFLFGRGDRERSAPPPPKAAATASGPYTPAEVYSGLRSQILALKPNELGIQDEHPFAVLMETGYDEAVATLVVIADGTTSLYFSNGGGVIGAGEQPLVRNVSSKFLADITTVADKLQATKDCPLPMRGRVRFYLLSKDGVRTAEASEQDLGHNRHELSHVFHSGHAVITAVREQSAAR
jgi:hypothetical protein